MTLSSHLSPSCRRIPLDTPWCAGRLSCEQAVPVVSRPSQLWAGRPTCGRGVPAPRSRLQARSSSWRPPSAPRPRWGTGQREERTPNPGPPEKSISANGPAPDDAPRTVSFSVPSVPFVSSVPSTGPGAPPIPRSPSPRTPTTEPQAPHEERRRPSSPAPRVAYAALGGRRVLGIGAGEPADREGLDGRPVRALWRAAARCPVHRSAEGLG